MSATKRHILIRRDQRAKQMGCSRSAGAAGALGCALTDVLAHQQLDSHAPPDEVDGRFAQRLREAPVNDSKTTREQRLAAALRANLRRRKQQARESAEDAPAEPADTSGEAPDPGGSGRKS